MSELDRQINERVSREWGPSFSHGSRRVAMAYPSPYRAGMSSLGYQWITTLLREAGISAERVFLPDEPDAYKRERRVPFTYETKTPLNQFPVIAISLAYELELAGLFELFRLAKIPVRREDRSEHDPVVVIGGPITMASPWCAAPFADVILMGEAENTAIAAIEGYFDCDNKESWYELVQALPGGHVPEFNKRLPVLAKAEHALLPARSAWITPDAELSNMFLLEGERGCHRMCSFCVMRRTTNGGMRLFDADKVLSLVPNAAKRVGLVGAAISDHPKLVPILEALVASGRQVSLSSLRADRVMRRPEITRLLRASGAKTLTVASDGASESLRTSISKGTKEKHLVSCAKQTGQHGFKVFKVYMIVGLPGETDADIDELIRFSLELAQAAKPARVALGVAPFVAKKNTPLDGEPFAGVKVVDRRMKKLIRGLKGRVEVRPVSSRWAWIEHLMSQGGPQVGEAYYQAWLEGGRFAHYKRHLLALPSSAYRPWSRPLES